MNREIEFIKMGMSDTEAKLCAAAPDMIKVLGEARVALTFYRKYIEDINEPKGHNTTYPFGVETELRVRAVIAKAKGESK